MIAALAWRNIWRQPLRTALTMTGMAFASMLLVFMLSFQFGSYDTMKSSVLKLSDGFGQFQPRGYHDAPETAKVIADPAALLADLRAVPAVTAASERASSYVLLANGARVFAASLTGIDPASEARVSRLPTLIRKGRALRPDDSRAIVLGEGLARDLQVKVGDRVTLLGSALDGSVAADVLTLVGIFRSGVPEIDRQMAQMPLARFRQTFLLGSAANVIAIVGRRLSDIVGAESRLRAIARKHAVVYLDWGKLQPAIKQAIALDMGTGVMMYAALVTVVVFIILNTLYMSVLERTHEFGVLLALGMRPGQIGTMVWLEMIFLSFVGNAIGIALGMVLTAHFERQGISFSGMEQAFSQLGLGRVYPRMTPLRVLLGPSVIIAAIAVLGVIPYARVLGLKPVSALSA